MNLAELTQKMNDLVQAKGWYDADSPRQQTLRNLAISLSLEAGEVLEYFQWREDVVDQEGLAGELADVALYLLQLSHIAGIDLETAILHKIEQNYARTWPEHEAQKEQA
ncbi:MAG: MazG-like family protein [Anaerolineaceae bacterium]